MNLDIFYNNDWYLYLISLLIFWIVKQLLRYIRKTMNPNAMKLTIYMNIGRVYSFGVQESKFFLLSFIHFLFVNYSIQILQSLMANEVTMLFLKSNQKPTKNRNNRLPNQQTFLRLQHCIFSFSQERNKLFISYMFDGAAPAATTVYDLI